MKTTTTENQHVRDHELKRRLEVLEAELQATAVREKLRLKRLHWMHCPKCGQELATKNLDTVAVDLCPGCQGLWLDANELKTIMANDSGFLESCRKVLRGNS